MTAKRDNIIIEQGATFIKVVNWYGGGKVIREIDDVTVGCPTRVTVAAHGMPANYDTPVFISEVRGARSLNSDGAVLATYVDANNFDVEAHTRDEVYVADTGCVVYYAPKTLTSWIARMDIRENLDDTTTLVSLTSVGGDIVINTTTAQITITITATVTAALDFDEGVYDLELEDDSGNVTRLLYGDVAFNKEVTRV